MSYANESSLKEQDPITPPEQESLTNVSDVLGFKTPEPLIDIEEPPKPVNLSPYEIYRTNSTPENLYKVTKSLKPTIDSAVATMGGGGNPQIAAKARVIAAKAVQTFDPKAGVSLPTWVSNQLRQLPRDIRKSNSVMSVPDGIMLDAYTIYRKTSEFEEENDREPTVAELADLTHLSKKRIEDVRKKMMPVVNETATESEDGESLLSGSKDDFSADALDYVYNDSDTTDQKLLEYTVGYGGEKVLDSKQIMDKLKLTPVQLTRRKARLAMRIQDIMEDLQHL